jgi:hypothetical protein
LPVQIVDFCVATSAVDDAAITGIPPTHPPTTAKRRR